MLKKLWGALKAPAMKAIDKLQATWPPNRVVVLVTPTVFVPVSAWLSGWAAQNLPGLPPLSPGWVAGVMGVGALAALKLADRWIDGWQKAEERDELGTRAPSVRRKKSTRGARIAIDGKEQVLGGPKAAKP